MTLPPLFMSRTPAQRLVLVGVVPAVFGAIAGVILGVSAPLYWVLQVLAIIGGFLAGQDTLLGITGWRWIFLVNVPIGIVALLVVRRTLHLHHQPHLHRPLRPIETFPPPCLLSPPSRR